MANQELVDVLKQGSANFWNMWRLTHPDVLLDLSRANLSGINLEGAIINRADLRGAHLEEANLVGANLTRAFLANADLHHANLGRTRLAGVDLSHANLKQALLSEADLYATLLTSANLTNADLTRTNLQGAFLDEANFNTTIVGWSIFGNVDLQRVKGLDTVIHRGPSSVGIDTLYRSKGHIPDIFLKGVGAPDSFIEYAHSLVTNPIQYYTCFLSHCSKDEAFAQRLYTDLQSKGVRCWYAPEDLEIGAKIRPRIDESIRLHDKLLLVLSQHSVSSQWVEQEVETALARERKEQKTILFPVRLDQTVMEIERGWPALIRNTRNIGNFTRWKAHDSYQSAFKRLLRDLKAEKPEGML